jgi:hypothetical protein
VAIIKKRLDLERSLSEILQIFTISLFEKVELIQVLTQIGLQTLKNQLCDQLFCSTNNRTVVSSSSCSKMSSSPLGVVTLSHVHFEIFTKRMCYLA